MGNRVYLLQRSQDLAQGSQVAQPKILRAQALLKDSSCGPKNLDTDGNAKVIRY